MADGAEESESLLTAAMVHRGHPEEDTEDPKKRADFAASIVPLFNNCSLQGLVSSTLGRDGRGRLIAITEKGRQALAVWEAIRVRRWFGPARLWHR